MAPGGGGKKKRKKHLFYIDIVRFTDKKKTMSYETLPYANSAAIILLWKPNLIVISWLYVPRRAPDTWTGTRLRESAISFLPCTGNIKILKYISSSNSAGVRTLVSRRKTDMGPDNNFTIISLWVLSLNIATPHRY